MNFVAIDIETANPDMASICQVGVVKYTDGKLIEEWSSLINPEDYFDGFNVRIHGIRENDVAGSPTFPEIAEVLSGFLTGNVSVCHTHFDRVSLGRSFARYKLQELETVWLDSARVARRTWKECASSGYGLANVCQLIGYEFKHHDALEDAKAAAQVVLAASKETGLDIAGWLKRVNHPIDPSQSSAGYAIKRDGNPEGPLFGEVLVFTGSLQVPRREAADLAAAVGCSVAAGVTKETTILVVGDQDILKLAGKSKSSKHLKAERLMSKGQAIRILKESDFVELVATTQTSI